MYGILRAVSAVVLLSVFVSSVPYVQRFLQTPETVRPLKLKTFSWNDCGSSDDIFRAISFSLTPDPIVLPGTLNVSFAMQFTEDFGSPLKASVLIAKKLGSNYVNIPCLGQFGTCDYDDFCEILDMIPQCPPPLQERNISCQCPFTKGIYSLPPTTAQVEYLPLVAGDYHARINMSTTIGTTSHHVGCYEVYLTLSEQYSIFGKN